MSRYPYWRCTSLDQKLPYPHYTNDVWNNVRCVYGNEHTPATEGAYDDRLDFSKKIESWEEVTSDKTTARSIQDLLSIYWGKPVQLVSIQYQIANNGYNYPYYRWNWKDNQTNDQ